jgi:hypothetical protein
MFSTPCSKDQRRTLSLLEHGYFWVHELLKQAQQRNQRFAQEPQIFSLPNKYTRTRSKKA